MESEKPIDFAEMLADTMQNAKANIDREFAAVETNRWLHCFNTQIGRVAFSYAKVLDAEKAAKVRSRLDALLDKVSTLSEEHEGRDVPQEVKDELLAEFDRLLD